MVSEEQLVAGYDRVAAVYTAVVTTTGGNREWSCFHMHRSRETATACAQRFVRRRQQGKCEHGCHWYAPEMRGTCCYDCQM